MKIHELFVYLHARNAEQAVAFYKEVFDAEETFRLVEPGGRLGHVELKMAGTTLMLSDEFPEYGCVGPQPDRPTAFIIHLHVDDADALINRAVAAGATLVRAPQDQFYGERSGTVRDPFGYSWMVGHSIEELEPAEMQRRYDSMATAPA